MARCALLSLVLLIMQLLRMLLVERRARADAAPARIREVIRIAQQLDERIDASSRAIDRLLAVEDRRELGQRGRGVLARLVVADVIEQSDQRLDRTVLRDRRLRIRIVRRKPPDGARRLLAYGLLAVAEHRDEWLDAALLGNDRLAIGIDRERQAPQRVRLAARLLAAQEPHERLRAARLGDDRLVAGVLLHHRPQCCGRALLRARLRVILERRYQPLGDLGLVCRVAKSKGGERVRRVLL